MPPEDEDPAPRKAAASPPSEALAAEVGATEAILTPERPEEEPPEPPPS
ncbi:MAG TPA: hypothetical protein VK002_07585 [Rubricoccaceae bacterium]|nr:hypothetical protein [Rubricoccaceae bacterium]